MSLEALWYIGDVQVTQSSSQIEWYVVDDEFLLEISIWHRTNGYYLLSSVIRKVTFDLKLRYTKRGAAEVNLLNL